MNEEIYLKKNEKKGTKILYQVVCFTKLNSKKKNEGQVEKYFVDRESFDVSLCVIKVL